MSVQAESKLMTGMPASSSRLRQEVAASASTGLKKTRSQPWAMKSSMMSTWSAALPCSPSTKMSSSPSFITLSTPSSTASQKEASPMVVRPNL